MKIFTDGFTIGSNPSKVGGGYIITDELGQRICRGDFSKAFTSNEAELQGIYKASQLASKGDEIYTDSQVAKNWVQRGACKARPDLSSIVKEAKINIEYKKLKLIQIPREENQAGIYIESNL